MNNFIQLTKVLFLSGFNVNKKKQNQKSAFRTLGIFGLVFLAVSCIYNAMYMNMAMLNGVSLTTYMLIVLVVDAMIVFVTCVFQMQTTIFKTKDYEFLESLPVRKTTIVAAKIAAVYLIGLFEDLLITIPAIVFYFIYNVDPNPGYFALLVFISTFFVSLIPILVASLI